ncbi:flavin reductase family protein [Rhodococcus opacus]|uniref:Putative oxidoreductase n=1 Tax=Rhodococcus opacus (strain B4) TaxID=632772 RepID=C1AYA9_RHOOB|nr:flavin reductase family protein [Rhodococcus opacus]BAH54104.1 putative oxidoreductase [Rhodococcus opacus B4]
MSPEPAEAQPGTRRDAPSPDEMRRALGQFASGVTVVTGLDTAGPVGFTCQSFASVSLEPPLILFCADHRGRAWPRIRRSGRFTINVLREDQTDVCARFGSSRGAKFDGLAWEPSRWSTPSLPGVLLRVHADVQSVHIAGDHDVVIGRVRELESVSEERPMVFFRGGFGLDAAPLPVRG